MPPNLTGDLLAIHASTLVMPLFTVNAQTGLSFTGAPMNSNFRPSNSTPGLPKSCWLNNPPIKWPIVSPSGLATL